MDRKEGRAMLCHCKHFETEHGKDGGHCRISGCACGVFHREHRGALVVPYREPPVTAGRTATEPGDLRELFSSAVAAEEHDPLTEARRRIHALEVALADVEELRITAKMICVRERKAIAAFLRSEALLFSPRKS